MFYVTATVTTISLSHTANGAYYYIHDPEYTYEQLEVNILY